MVRNLWKNLLPNLFAAQSIFHVLNKTGVRFDLVYITLGYIFMYLGESWISLRQASKKAKLDRNSLINNLKNVTFNIIFWINFHHFCMQNVIKCHFKDIWNVEYQWYDITILLLFKVILYAAPFFCLPRQLDAIGSGNPSVFKKVACLGVKKTR